MSKLVRNATLVVLSVLTLGLVSQPLQAATGDSVPPAAPMLTTPVDGKELSRPLVRLAGTTEPGTQLIVYINDTLQKVHGKKRLDLDNQGTFDFYMPLKGAGVAGSEYEISVYARDVETGLTSVKAATTTVTLGRDFLAHPFTGTFNNVCVMGLTAPASNLKLTAYILSPNGHIIGKQATTRTNHNGEYTISLQPHSMYLILANPKTPYPALLEVNTAEVEGTDLGKAERFSVVPQACI